MTGSTQLPGERQLAVDLLNGVWTLLGADGRIMTVDDRMLHMAPASRYH